MRIFLQTDDDLLFLAGDGRVSDRVFSRVSDFDLTGQIENQILRKVRGSHARAIARGNCRHRAFFRTRRMFATPREAELFATDVESAFPRTGTLYFVTGAGTRKLYQTEVGQPLATVRGCEVRLQYQASGGEISPLEPELVIDGASGLLHRIVEENDEKWFEVGFDSPVALNGNAAEGWTDPDGHLLLRMYRSENLTSWDFDWIPCPTSPETITGGFRYWARAKYPVDSKVKSGQLRAKSVSNHTANPGELKGDARNNPFTKLTVAGVNLALGGFPYTMGAAGEAARMQTDLAVLFPGSTVTATSDILWEIVIPGVTNTNYAQMNKVWWEPGYLTSDMFGDLTILIDGHGLSGEFDNSAGVRTSVTKQFARLGVSAGPNHLY